jgi:hypothetical protein
MPELLAHTNLDVEGMTKVRDLIEDLLRFIAEDPNRWVADCYESGLCLDLFFPVTVR